MMVAIGDDAEVEFVVEIEELREALEAGADMRLDGSPSSMMCSISENKSLSSSHTSTNERLWTARTSCDIESTISVKLSGSESIARSEVIEPVLVAVVPVAVVVVAGVFVFDDSVVVEGALKTKFFKCLYS